MLRKLIFAVSVIALTFAACGRQVTPDRPDQGGSSGLPPGFMQATMTVAGTLDFTNVAYVFVFNTSGTGGQPYPQGLLTNYQNYSFVVIVGGTGGAVAPQVYQIVRGSNGGVPTKQIIPYTPQQLQFNPNSNGQGNQFSITFDRNLFNGIVPTPTPGSGANPDIWFVNWITATPLPALQAIDAPGIGGPIDNTFTFPQGSPGMDVTTSFFQQWVSSAGWPTVSNPDAQLAGGAVANSP